MSTYVSFLPSNSLILPSQTGNAGKYLTTDGTSLSWGTPVSQNITSGVLDKSPSEDAVYQALALKVTGASSATDGTIALFDGNTGKMIRQGLGWTIDSGALCAQTDGMYNIGKATDNRPGYVYVKTTINLDSLSTNQILASNSSKNIISLDTTTYPSLTELSYVKGVTSGIQGQLNALQPAGNYITDLTGEVTATGPGSVTATIAGQTGNQYKVLSTTGSSATWQYAGLGDGTFGTLNVIVGKAKPTSLAGIRVTLLGAGTTGDALTTGQYNVLVGANVGPTIDTGSNNTLIGTSITNSAANQSGSTAVGSSITVSGNGTSIGSNSKAGTRGISLGDSAGNTNGTDNIAIGGGSVRNNTAGNYNIGIGSSTLNAAGIGSYNVALGYSAGKFAASSNELYIGNQAYASNAVEKTNSLMYGQFNATPSSQTLTINAAVTATYGLTTTTVKQNGATSGTLTHAVPATVTSYTMTYPSAQGAANTYLKNDGSGNLSWATAGVVTVAGDVYKVLAFDGTTTSFQYAGLGDGSFGTNNIILGKGKPASFTTANNNTIISTSTAGGALTTGTNNIIISDTGASANTTQTNSVIIGNGIGNTIPGGSVIVGQTASGSNTNGAITAVGASAIAGASAFSTVVVGSSAATQQSQTVAVGAASVASGQYSNAIGFSATAGSYGTLAVGGLTYAKGNYSTSLGSSAGNSGDSGTYNLFVGYSAGSGASTSGGSNSALGAYSAYLLTTGARNVFLGYFSGYRSTTQSDELFIDNQDRTTYAGQQTNSLIYGTFNATPSSQTVKMNAAVTATYGVSVSTAGYGLAVKEGSNAKMGTVTLAAGTATVSTTAVTANSRIFLTVQSLGTILVPVAVAVTSRTAGTSFVITSANVTDTSVVAWMIVEAV